MKKMMRVMAGLLLVAMPIFCAHAAQIPVPPGANTLARAIAGAQPGDRLMLQEGEYGGGVALTQPMAIIGTGKTHINGGQKGSVITVDAPDVIISGLVINGSGSSHENVDSGVFLTQKAQRAVIRDNDLEGNLYGVNIHGARNALVENNVIIGRRGHRMNRRGNGVYVWNAPGAQVNGNIVRFGRDGIFVNTSRKNTFRNNRFEHLRFGVHYMYANDSEISGNVSIGNHLGYAIMFTSHMKIIGNTSIDDRDHGIMLNYVNDALIVDNVVKNGGRKCLFMYNANKNIVKNNRFEGCLIGIHFTAGSNRNKITGNDFVNNRIQVKFVGSHHYVWSGNYWSNHAGYDVNGDGIADQAFYPNDMMDQILWTQPSAKLLLGSPAIKLIRWAQREFPALLPGGVMDDKPLLRPIHQEVPDMAAQMVVQ